MNEIQNQFGDNLEEVLISQSEKQFMDSQMDWGQVSLRSDLWDLTWDKFGVHLWDWSLNRKSF